MFQTENCSEVAAAITGFSPRWLQAGQHEYTLCKQNPGSSSLSMCPSSPLNRQRDSPGESLLVWTFPSSQIPPRVPVPFWCLFFSHFCPLTWNFPCNFGSIRDLPVSSKFLWELFTLLMYFWCVCGGEVSSTSYSAIFILWTKLYIFIHPPSMFYVFNVTFFFACIIS